MNHAMDNSLVTSVEVSTSSSSMMAARSNIRVAVIGGIAGNGFWQAVTERFIAETGYSIELVVRGPKDVIVPYMRDGKVDLLSMHSSDAIINLVADGYAQNPQPWLRNDLMLVGPANDPAEIRGLSAVAALQKISGTGAKFIIHASLGAQEVLRDALAVAKVELAPSQTLALLEDKQHKVMKIAAENQAYTLVGRLPYLDGKIPSHGMEIMVRGDTHLRRPYLVITANPRKFPEANVAGAEKLVKYLRSPATQRWIKEYGKGRFDDFPLFYPVEEEAWLEEQEWGGQ